jgi:hypothetical protein
MNENHKASKVPLVFEFQAGDTIDRNSVQRKKLGHAPFSKIYHEMGIHQFMINRQRNLKINYQLNEVLKMLAFQRILEPASKLKNFERKDHYFGKYDFSLADVYSRACPFDGYYAIVISECDLPDEQIVDTYQGLWRIEESFRITKSDLENRPVYVSRKDHIQAHFLTCFIALLLLRILERKTEHKYSPARMIESLNAVSGVHLQQNYYMSDYYDEAVEHIGNTLGIDFSRRILPWGEIRSLLTATNK